MSSIRMFIWRLIVSFFPSYFFRNFCFKFFLKNSIGKRSSIHRGLEIFCDYGIVIGHDTTINKYVNLDGRGGLIIGNCVSVSPYVKILSASHQVNSSNFQYIIKPVLIEDYVWIGTDALILPGVVLGKGSVVAAGSVVTKSVDPFTIVGGNPAVKISNRQRDLSYSPFWRPPLQ